MSAELNLAPDTEDWHIEHKHVKYVIRHDSFRMHGAAAWFVFKPGDRQQFSRRWYSTPQGALTAIVTKSIKWE